MAASLLEVDGLETAYGRSQVLFGLDLRIGKGHTVGLMGRNGMGKTTTIRSIMGLTKPLRGRIRINGIEYQGQPAFRVARAGLSIVPEGRQVFRQLTVKEHLLMATSNQKGTSDTWNVQSVFDLFPRLADRHHHFGSQLSGGEQQMLAIGRALITNPQLILFDEATEGLAPLIRAEIWSAIASLKQRGTASLIVDKNVNDMARIADYLYVLEKGRIAWSGTPKALQEDLGLQQRFLGI